jgi:hypothetical protein
VPNSSGSIDVHAIALGCDPDTSLSILKYAIHCVGGQTVFVAKMLCKPIMDTIEALIRSSHPQAMVSIEKKGKNIDICDVECLGSIGAPFPTGKPQQSITAASPAHSDPYYAVPINGDTLNQSAEIDPRSTPRQRILAKQLSVPLNQAASAPNP